MYPLLVTAALIEHQGEFLLTRRRGDVPYPLLWEFPGGKVEPGEDPRDCIVREIREELGMEVAAEEIYDVIYHRYPERTVLVLVYRCRWLRGDVVDLEVAEHRWVLPGEISRLSLLPADVPLAERIGRESGQADTRRL